MHTVVDCVCGLFLSSACSFQDVHAHKSLTDLFVYVWLLYMLRGCCTCTGCVHVGVSRIFLAFTQTPAMKINDMQTSLAEPSNVP